MHLLKKKIIPPISPKRVPGFALKPNEMTYISKRMAGWTIVKVKYEKSGKRWSILSKISQNILPIMHPIKRKAINISKFFLISFIINCSEYWWNRKYCQEGPYTLLKIKVVFLENWVNIGFVCRSSTERKKSVLLITLQRVLWYVFLLISRYFCVILKIRGNFIGFGFFYKNDGPQPKPWIPGDVKRHYWVI